MHKHKTGCGVVTRQPGKAPAVRTQLSCVSAASSYRVRNLPTRLKVFLTPAACRFCTDLGPMPGTEDSCVKGGELALARQTATERVRETAPCA